MRGDRGEEKEKRLRVLMKGEWDTILNVVEGASEDDECCVLEKSFKTNW